MSFIVARRCLLFVLLFSGLAVAASAAPTASAGPYRFEIRTDPAVVPVGKATLVIDVTRDGRPVDGAEVRVLAQMPAMPMGEREEKAVAVAGSPGRYSAPASFGMGGAYDVTVTVRGPAGEGRAVLALTTGDDTSVASGAVGRWKIALSAVAVAVVILGLMRLRRLPADSRPHLHVSRGLVGTLLLLAGSAAVANYAVQNWRRPGAMTLLQAQGMEMKVPAPPGSLPVVLGEVRVGTVENVVRYSGQVVGYVEQDVYPRTQGVILEMPVYVGTRVRAGQIVARLDVTQLAPQVSERRAAVTTGELQARAAESETLQAAAGRTQAAAEVSMKVREVDEARANLEAAGTQTRDAGAQLHAALADRAYWRAELARSQKLVDEGAFSIEEHQRTQAQAAAADARVRQAQARVWQVRAQIEAARAAVAKAESDLSAHRAHVAQADAAYAASRDKAAASQASVAQSRASLQAMAAQQGYADIRAEADGVVTQRLVSPGTLVSPGQPILRVAQIRPIRLQANVAAVDLAAVRVGTPVQVWLQDARGAPLAARITSVQPAQDPVSRTGVVEAVVANRDGRLLPGAYISMAIPTRRAVGALTVPVDAVRERAQEERQAPQRFVWAAEPGGDGSYRVRAREVEVLARDGERTAVKGDLKAGVRVVSGGGQYLQEGDEVTAQAAATEGPRAAPAADGLTVDVTEKGFQPARLEAVKGKVRITFIRRTDRTCAKEVVFPTLGIRKPLPLDQPVTVEFHAHKAGEISFTCGMNMLQGTVVVK